MAESPIYKLARLVGGVSMLPGPLGHQALGQLLISGSKNLEVAGANVALAAAFMQPHLAIQVAVGTLVPAVAIEALSRKEQRRIEVEQQRLERLSAELLQQSSEVGKKALLSMVPAPVVEALIRNEVRRRQADQQKQQELQRTADDHIGEIISQRTTELSQALESQRSQYQELLKNVGEIRSENERLRQETIDLRSQLEKHAQSLGTTTVQTSSDSNGTQNQDHSLVSSDERATPTVKNARNDKAIKKARQKKGKLLPPD